MGAALPCALGAVALAGPKTFLAEQAGRVGNENH